MNRKGCYISLLLLLLLVFPMVAQDVVPGDPFVGSDPLVDPMAAWDSVPASSESGRKQGAIDARVEYTSSDSLVMTGKGIAHMYGDGEVRYKALELKAEYIRVCMDSSTLYASGVLDTIEDEWIGQPVFKDANDSYESKQITYNLKTQ